MPDITKKCIQTWRNTNPTYDIRVLNRTKLKDYLPDVDIFNLKFADTPLRISDFIRLNILSKYGGVWIDATSIIPQSLQWSDNYVNYDLIGYYMPSNCTRPEYKVMESWFFICRPGCEIISKWRDEFMRVNNYSTITDYVKSLQTEGVDLQNIGDYERVTLYCSFQRVLQLQVSPEEIGRIYLFSTDDHQRHWGGNYKQVLCSDTKLDVPVVKFTHYDREDMGSEYQCVFRHYYTAEK
jgi:hypothetical protein